MYRYTRWAQKVHIGLKKVIFTAVKVMFWDPKVEKCTLVDICTCCIMSSFKCLHLIKSLLLCCSREVKKARRMRALTFKTFRSHGSQRSLLLFCTLITEASQVLWLHLCYSYVSAQELIFLRIKKCSALITEALLHLGPMKHEPKENNLWTRKKRWFDPLKTTRKTFVFLMIKDLS